MEYTQQNKKSNEPSARSTTALGVQKKPTEANCRLGARSAVPAYLQKHTSSVIQKKCVECGVQTPVEESQSSSVMPTKLISDQLTQTKPVQAKQIQTKLTVGAADDDYEKEADIVADKVASYSNSEQNFQSTSSVSSVQRTCNNSAAALQLKSNNQQTPPAVTPSVNQVVTNPSAGERINSNILSRTESVLNTDLSQARVHQNPAANTAADSIQAKAFTHKNDIFLGSGQSASDTKLMSHELTHTAQQSDPLQRKPATIQRDNNEANTPTVNTETDYDGPEGTATTNSNGQIVIREITFPNVTEKQNKTGSSNVEIRKGSEERNTNQITVWSQLVRENDSGLNTQLDSKISDAHQSGSESNPTYFMRIGRRGGNYLVGTRTDIKNRVMRPYWLPNARIKTFDVDHIKEYQLGGHDRSPADNLWLLDSATNRSSGSQINSKVNQALGSLISRWNSSTKPDVETARNNYRVTLQQINWTGPVAGDGANYTVADIGSEANQMDAIYPMSSRAVRRAGIDPGEGQFVIFNNATGGRARTIELPSSTGDQVAFTDPNFIQGFRPSTAIFSGEDSNYLEIRGQLWADNPALDWHGTETSFSISRMTHLPRAGYMNVTQAERQIREIFGEGINANGMSPLRLEKVGFDETGAPNIEGKVITDVRFLEGADIGFFIRGNDLGIEKTFTAGDVNTPSPFEIDNAFVTVSLSTQRGLAAEGHVGFKIDSVGYGNVTASVGTSQQFGLAGNFVFDERIFGAGTNAEVRMAYENDQWSLGGTISIPENKVPGVRRATINVDYSEATGFAARGDAELDIPGVESGTLEITQNENGFAIGGTFGLSADTPGIRGGTISANLQEKPDGSGYAISATGEAQPDIPGINSNLLVSYNDGAFTAEITAEYARGMLSGEITAGVTNRSVGDDGLLSETAEENNPLIVYGGGSLTVQIAPWLQGTAGVNFAPNGELTVTGEIGLPNEIEIFDRKSIEKDIFNVAVQAPIVPGIVAEIGGGLGAQAGIGPGVIDELRLGITYNPEREEDTQITGDAHLNIPADAGLRLSARAGIGLGITGASATGGLEIGGSLGISGAAEAGVHLEWSPSAGLDLSANVAVHAQPSFTFDIAGYVSVRALGFSVYDETYQLASMTYGSDYRFGIGLPIHYQEGEPFDISLDDVEFEIPDININQLVRGLISRVT